MLNAFLLIRNALAMLEHRLEPSALEFAAPMIDLRKAMNELAGQLTSNDLQALRDCENPLDIGDCDICERQAILRDHSYCDNCIVYQIQRSTAA